jgi:hypothetical protein
VILSKIRAWKLEDVMTEIERDLHFLPDGAWNEADSVSVVARGAELEALLWASRIQDSLRPIEDLNVVIAPATSIPTRIENNVQCHDRYDIQAQANVAFHMWLRSLAELRHRGISDERFSDPELVTASKDVSSDRADQSADLVLGTKLITECSDAELRIAFEQAGMRASTLTQFLAERQS